jgi:hypothetical protein
MVVLREVARDGSDNTRFEAISFLHLSAFLWFLLAANKITY